jgi:hypothetical protein
MDLFIMEQNEMELHPNNMHRGQSDVHQVISVSHSLLWTVWMPLLPLHK